MHNIKREWNKAKNDKIEKELAIGDRKRYWKFVEE
jgi:hypothetical protein